MKSALQWRSEEDLFLKAKYTPETVVKIIKAIQIDAWKEGARWALNKHATIAMAQYAEDEINSLQQIPQ